MFFFCFEKDGKRAAAKGGGKKSEGKTGRMDSCYPDGELSRFNCHYVNT